MESPADPTLADDEGTLAVFASDLADGIDAAIPRWVERSLRVAAGAGGAFLEPSDVLTVAAATREVVMPELRRILAADVDADAGSPLEALRCGVGPMTACLDRRGAARPPRDEFLVRQYPSDPYGLGPASFADIDPGLHEPGLLWGAARAHVHLRRRREGEGTDG